VGLDALEAAIKPGIRQTAAVAAAEYIVKEQGADETFVFMGAGTPWVSGLRRGDLIFEEGDVLSLEFGARYHGYVGEVCRTVFLGQPSEEGLRALDTAKAALERMLEMLKPGVTGDQVYRAGWEEVERRGTKYHTSNWGHGRGLLTNEGFLIEEGDETPIPEGVYGIVHPFLTHMDVVTGRGLFNVLWGDPWILRADGPEFLV
jgi:Xaa-Pro aminopeptidase